MGGSESGRTSEILAQVANISDPVAFLEQLFAQAPVAFQIYRPDGHCLLVNQAFRELFGSEPPPEYNVLRDEVAEKAGILPLVRRAFAGETVSSPPTWYDARELQQVRVTEGKRVAIGATFFPLRDRAGGVAYIAVVFKDVTRELEDRERLESERARAEANAARWAFLSQTGKLLSSSLDYEETLRAVARLAVPRFADWCFLDMIGDSGEVDRVEVAFADPADAALAQEVKRFPPSAALGSANPASRAMAQRTSVIVEAIDDDLRRAIAANDEHLQALRATQLQSLISVPLVARERMLGTMTFVFGKSGRHFRREDLETAEELAARAALSIDNARLFGQTYRMSESLANASRVKDEFLAMLGHELRNPLAPIVTALELMRVRAGEVALRERETIGRQVKHLSRLVDDLLDVSRITRGQIELRRKLVRLADVAARAVELAAPMIDERGHQLLLEVPGDLTVPADELRLAQVVANLLTNAGKYTEPGGRITVTASRDGDAIEIRVKDTGIGIGPELLPRIFELFTQGTRTVDRSQGGLGLGLAIVKSLVQLHGGSVSAHSEGKGLGSEFVVRLPVAMDGYERHDSAPHAGLGADVAKNGRIMVVDDNTDAAELLADWLGESGHVVETAGDGAAALELARRFRPQLALVDIGLPIMDGFELARAMRADPTLSGTALVALTGYGQESDRSRTHAAGFVEHLVKPVDLERLEAVINRLLAARRGPEAHSPL